MQTVRWKRVNAYKGDLNYPYGLWHLLRPTEPGRTVCGRRIPEEHETSEHPCDCRICLQGQSGVNNGN